VTSCDKVRCAFLGDLELQGERLRPEATDIRRDFDHVIKHERLVEIDMDLDTWKPDVQMVDTSAYGSPTARKSSVSAISHKRRNCPLYIMPV
jgi:hypothetical protein